MQIRTEPPFPKVKAIMSTTPPRPTKAVKPWAPKRKDRVVHHECTLMANATLLPDGDALHVRTNWARVSDEEADKLRGAPNLMKDSATVFCECSDGSFLSIQLSIKPEKQEEGGKEAAGAGAEE